jgi:SAM-dependent methyltransferase
MTEREAGAGEEATDRVAALEAEVDALRQAVFELGDELEREALQRGGLELERFSLEKPARTRTARYPESVRRILAWLRPSLPAPPAAPATRTFRDVRTQIAARYLHGSGIEVGALNEPLRLPESVEVTYVDRLGIDQLREEFPEFADRALVAPDVVDDGEALGSFPDGTLDFVAANHFIEHCENPIGTLQNHLRVVVPGGVVFLAVPDKRRTFDVSRPLTTAEHLLRDHRHGAAGSRWDHYLEYARLTDRVPEPHDRARYLLERGYRIHFHVWTPQTFAEFLSLCHDEISIPFTVDEVQQNDFEFIVVLHRTG